MKTHFISKLASRGLVRVAGEDGLKFLQSLVTADVHSLCGTPGGGSGNDVNSKPAKTSTAAGFLDRRGRSLFGSLLHCHKAGEYLIDVPRTDVERLMKHLRMFCLRSKVDIEDVTLQHSVWQLVGYEHGDDIIRNNVDNIIRDPRLSFLGYRTVLENDDQSTLTDDDDQGELHYERFRTAHAIPDGNDFKPGTLPLEVGLQFINGVSFSKGCYLGQELTARTHHVGTLRKRLTTVMLLPPDADGGGEQLGNVVQQDLAHSLIHTTDNPIKVGEEIFIGGVSKPCATVTSAIDNMGLAVLRMTDSLNDEKTFHLADGRRVRCVRHTWWGETSS